MRLTAISGNTIETSNKLSTIIISNILFSSEKRKNIFWNINSNRALSINQF